MSTPSSAADFKIKRPAQIMTYPKTGIPKTGIPAGRVTLSLVDGKVSYSSGSGGITDDNFDKSLTDMGDRKARSCLVWVNDAGATIKVGNATLPTGARLIHVMNAIGFDNITIDFPSGRIPVNDFTLLVMASVSTIFSWDSFKHHVSHESIQTLALTDNNQHAIILKSCHGYNNILITSSAAVNAAEIQIQFSEDGVTWFNDPNYDNPLVAAVGGPPDRYGSSAIHKFIQVLIKNNVANNNSTVTVYLRLTQT